MDPKTLIAQRVSQEIRPSTLVNLGIGLPTMVAKFVPNNAGVFFQSENGLAGIGHLPADMENQSLTDAGGGAIGALPGAATFDSAFSFGLIRGGHLDMTVLGGLQVDERGLLANWIIPGQMIPGMGGAMDLVSGARRVVVAMTHLAKGKSKLVQELTLPKTSDRPVDLIVTDYAVIRPTAEGLVLEEIAPGMSVQEVQDATDANPHFS